MPDRPTSLPPPSIELTSYTEPFDGLNATFGCIQADIETVGRRILPNEILQSPGERLQQYASLLSATPVFVTADTLLKMREVVNAIFNVCRLPDFQESALQAAPKIAQTPSALKGVLMGFDFHLTPDGPKLIEVNTNAGGALVNSALLNAQSACCDSVEGRVVGRKTDSEIEQVILESFLTEWRASGNSDKPSNVVILESRAKQQYLYPELILFQGMFRNNRISASIAQPEELEYWENAIYHNGQRIDFIYNRLTDFYFQESVHTDLRTAYEYGSVLITPNPRHHAIFANKTLFTRFSDQTFLDRAGATIRDVQLLNEAIPDTQHVTARNADRLWAQRKKLFFKPANGFGSRGVYAGAKLTRKTWNHMLENNYIAQQYVAPSTSPVIINGKLTELKTDIRAYAYDGVVQLFSARRYSGQTTNMRTPGGGFTSVFSTHT